jgi:hypothetical protein
MNTEKKELAKGIIIPVLSDYILSPEVLYADNETTGIYFRTPDDQFGRITFNNLDAIKVCRGEYIPYSDDWTEDKDVPWVYSVANSTWLLERYAYENNYYGAAYEFGGNVNDMFTDFSHYVFRFHDQFVEVIARGFWFEQDTETLFKKPLMQGHPLLPLPQTKVTMHEASCIVYKVIYNTLPEIQLVENSFFCPQKLLEVEVDYKGNFSSFLTLVLTRRNGKVTSILRTLYGVQIFEAQKVTGFEDVKESIEKEITIVAERRKQY